MAKSYDDDSFIPAVAGGALDLLPGGSLVSVFGERGAKLVLQEWRRNRSLTLSLAIKQAGLSREDLEELLIEHPRVVPLLIRTLHAAGMTGQDKTLRLLAGFLGHALADVSSISDVETLIGAVQNLTEHHIKVLEIVSSSRSDYPQLTEVAGDRWTTGLVVSISSMRSELTLVGVQGLLATGFLSDAGLDGGGATWGDLESGGTILKVTELGRTVLNMLGEVAEANRPGPQA
jgi:hypothetical protein